MDWAQFLILILTLTGLFIWNRTESRADYRHLESGVNAQIEAIRQDIKDFHGRLEKQDAEYKSHMMHLHKGKG